VPGGGRGVDVQRLTLSQRDQRRGDAQPGHPTRSSILASAPRGICYRCP